MTRQPDNSSTPHGPSPDRGVLDEALEPEQVRSLNAALRGLSESDGAGKDLQDAAKRMLTGRLALRDALDDPAMARALGGGMANLRGQWEALSEEERERIRRGEAPPTSGPAGAPSVAPSGPPSGDVPSSGSAGTKRSDGEAAQPGNNRSQGRHSGGFSLY
ncbi:hypothetical protein GCM10010145_66010 [Streptomyces ruber]|uniref:Uncharacterized protein n=2 Tax=Streptomyces TaxID=1883 RepID=A0A918BRI6_9ACTN|nr:hypothetical protein [Streptomyces ruber]GGQ87353.1 hypothetical protein GCM10010145_66010 [Streptomyces ruber]